MRFSSFSVVVWRGRSSGYFLWRKRSYIETQFRWKRGLRPSCHFLVFKRRRVTPNAGFLSFLILFIFFNMFFFIFFCHFSYSPVVVITHPIWWPFPLSSIWPLVVLFSLIYQCSDSATYYHGTVMIVAYTVPSGSKASVFYFYFFPPFLQTWIEFFSNRSLIISRAMLPLDGTIRFCVERLSSFGLLIFSDGEHGREFGKKKMRLFSDSPTYYLQDSVSTTK